MCTLPHGPALVMTAAVCAVCCSVTDPDLVPDYHRCNIGCITCTASEAFLVTANASMKAGQAYSFSSRFGYATSITRRQNKTHLPVSSLPVSWIINHCQGLNLALWARVPSRKLAVWSANLIFAIRTTNTMSHLSPWTSACRGENLNASTFCTYRSILSR